MRARSGCAVFPAILVAVVFAPAASAMPIPPEPTYWFEMTVAPDAEAAPMTKVGDGFGDLAAGDFGAPNFAGLQNGTNGPAGTARFVDSGSNGNDGYYIQGFTGGWSVDMRISVEAAMSGIPPRHSLSVREASGSGRGVGIEPNTGGDSMILNFVNLGGVVGTAIVPDDPLNASNFHMIRLSLPNNGSVLVYDLENDLDAGPGFDWKLLATIGLGSSGFAGELNTGGGFALNSLSGNTTLFSKFSADWIRITIPEPATAAFLAVGASLLLCRRR